MKEWLDRALDLAGAVLSVVFGWLGLVEGELRAFLEAAPLAYAAFVLLGVPLAWFALHLGVARPLVRTLERRYGGRLVVRSRKVMGHETSSYKSWWEIVGNGTVSRPLGLRFYHRAYGLLGLVMGLLSATALWVLLIEREPGGGLELGLDHLRGTPLEALSAAWRDLVTYGADGGWPVVAGAAFVGLGAVIVLLDPTTNLKRFAEAADDLEVEDSRRPGESVVIRRRSGGPVRWEPAFHLVRVVTWWLYFVHMALALHVLAGIAEAA